MNDSPIEDYLDALFTQLRTAAPRDARSMLVEAEAHLHEAAASAERAGLTAQEAELDAVERFGDASVLARHDRDRRSAGLATRVLVSAWTLGAVGATAVGVSGMIAAAMRLAGVSNQFLAGHPSTTSPTSGDCARWLAAYPHAASCAQAATADWAWEIVAYRIAFGVLGLVAFGAVTFARKHWTALRLASLPKIVIDTIATVGFAGAAIWLAGMGTDALIVNTGQGAGQWLSAAPVALAASIYFGVPFAKRIKTSGLAI
jgi:hypothetical protein